MDFNLQLMTQVKGMFYKHCHMLKEVVRILGTTDPLSMNGSKVFSLIFYKALTKNIAYFTENTETETRTSSITFDACTTSAALLFGPSVMADDYFKMFYIFFFFSFSKTLL